MSSGYTVRQTKTMPISDAGLRRSCVRKMTPRVQSVKYVLVMKNDVGSPDVIDGYLDICNVPGLGGIPFEEGVIPFLK